MKKEEIPINLATRLNKITKEAPENKFIMLKGNFLDITFAAAKDGLYQCYGLCPPEYIHEMIVYLRNEGLLVEESSEYIPLLFALNRMRIISENTVGRLKYKQIHFNSTEISSLERDEEIRYERVKNHKLLHIRW